MKLDGIFIKKYNELINKDVEMALKFSEKCLKESNNPDFNAYIADCYMTMDEYEKAINILREGLSNNCNNSIYAKSLIGECLFYIGDFKESKVIFDELYKENPSSFFVVAYLMDVNINLKKYNSAIELGETFLNLSNVDNKDRAYILVSIGWINLKYLAKYDIAINKFNEAIQLESKFGRAYVGLGEYYLIVQEYEKALVNFEKAIELEEGTIEVYFNISMCYKGLEQYEDALSYLYIVKDADPENEIYINEIKQLESR